MDLHIFDMFQSITSMIIFEAQTIPSWAIGNHFKLTPESFCEDPNSLL